MVDEVPLFWRSGRQSLITVSTAESELTESMTAGESVSVLFEELYGKVRKVAWCDNQAAITILVNDGGSWRTRHLRMRSAFARQSVMRGEWQIAHLPGEKMIADIGTKALTSTRLTTLKELMGMSVIPGEESAKDEEGREEMKDEEKKEEQRKGEDLRMRKAVAVRLIVLAAQMSLSKGSEDERKEQRTKNEEEEGEVDFQVMVVFYTVVVVVFTLLIQWMWKVGVRWMAEESRKSSLPNARSLPAEPDQKKKKEEGWKKESESKKSVKEKDEVQEVRERTMEEPSSSTGPINNVTLPMVAPTVPEGEGETIGFRVLVTRFGKVYHLERNCSYLKSPATGMAPEHRWCPTCRALDQQAGARHVVGAKLKFEDERAVFHTNAKCSLWKGSKKKKACSRCMSGKK